MTRNKEFERFNNLTRELLKVSHGEVKAKLDAEKQAKKRKKAKKSSALGLA